MALQCPPITVLGIGGISTFWKNWVQVWGEYFFAICSEWVSELCHCDQSPLGTQLGVETQPLRVTFGPKIDSPDAMINIR